MMPAKPEVLFHATRSKMAKQYRESGCIKGPVRGFDTLTAAMAWAIRVGRKVIYEVRPVGEVNRLPDHHNEFGSAWWTETVPMSRVRCVYSGDSAWVEAKKP